MFSSLRTPTLFSRFGTSANSVASVTPQQNQPQPQPPPKQDNSNASPIPRNPARGLPTPTYSPGPKSAFSMPNVSSIPNPTTITRPLSPAKSTRSVASTVVPSRSGSVASVRSNSTKTVNGSDACHVTVRMRPLTIQEESLNAPAVWEVDEESNRLALSWDYVDRNKKSAAEYYFDAVQMGSDNKELYEGSAMHVIRAAMEGINGTVFAYGQTASGKTYSMMGIDEQPGVIPQAVDDIFAYIREQSGDREYLLRVSYMEIYNETIRDLLSPEQVELRIHEDRKRGVFVSPLKEEIVTSPKQVMRIIRKGEENRHFGATDYNEHSSRSHTIFQMIIESRDRAPSSPVSPRRPSTKGRGAVTISQLNLIDLAGSEKATSDLDRRKEGAYINKSLLTLGTVISRLTDEKNSGLHIPYRDSKLTRILQSSLAGNARISVICTISPAGTNAEETHNTLKFAARVKKVVVKASANRIMDEKALLEKYKHEIEELRQQLTETNQLLEKERTGQKDKISEEERRKYQEQLREGQIARTALKERIEHLTNLILTSKTITNKQLLDWNAPAEPGVRASVMVEDGLLPTSPERNSSIKRPYGHSKQGSDREFMRRHIREIDVRDEKIRTLELLVAQLKDSRDPNVVAQIQQYEQTEGKSLQTHIGVQEELETAKKQKGELEAVCSEQEQKIVRLERQVAESKAAMASVGVDFEKSELFRELKSVAEKQRSKLEDLVNENKALRSTVKGLNSETKELQSKLAVTEPRSDSPTSSSGGSPTAPSTREFTETIASQRTQIAELLNENKSLHKTVKGLRDSIRMLELSNDMFVQSAARVNGDESMVDVRASRVSDRSGSSSNGDRDEGRYKDLELALERERKMRGEEARMATERIASLEAELAIAKAELGVVQMIPVFSRPQN